MLNISNFIAGVEKIMFQLISWIILIPKTLFWILASPVSTIEYFKDNIDENKNYQHFISPIFLYLFVAIAPLILRNQFKIPDIEIKGEKVAMVDSTYTYQAEVGILSDLLEFRLSDYVYQCMWSISEDGKSFVQVKADNYPKKRISKLNEFKTQWKDSGRKVVRLYVLSYELKGALDVFDETGSDYNGVQYKDLTYIDRDTIYMKDLNIQVFNDELSYKNKTEELMIKSQANRIAVLTEKDLYKLALLYLLFPLAFAVGIIISEKEDLTYDRIKENLYVQSALFSPVMMVFQIALIFEYFIPHEYLGETITLFFFFEIIVAVIWLVLVESRVYDVSVKEVIAVLGSILVIIVISLAVINESLLNYIYFKYLAWVIMILILIPIVMSFFGYHKDFEEDEDFNGDDDD